MKIKVNDSMVFQPKDRKKGFKQLSSDTTALKKIIPRQFDNSKLSQLLIKSTSSISMSLNSVGMSQVVLVLAVKLPLNVFFGGLMPI